MNNRTLKLTKVLTVIGLLFGFACGFLYGIGGFIHDFLLTGINRGSYLALNALWGMPLLFGAMGLVLGIVITLIRLLFKR